MIWMAVTADEYEQPLAVCRTRKELANSLGVGADNVAHLKKQGRSSRNRFNGYRYKVVVVEEIE